ncbi:MAG: pantetheine-phosphate adenylyltransferase [Oscillospiraceae bacterium]
MRTAVCPGSFDPVTFGHIDIFKRASTLFDEVIVLVSVNPSKKHASFTIEERVAMIKAVTKDIPNIKVDTFDGLLADYVKEKKACAIVKGLRAVSDFEYEFQMALANKKLCPEAETVFLTTSSEYMFLSSSVVKQISSLGGDISAFVPKEILNIIKERLNDKELEK